MLLNYFMGSVMPLDLRLWRFTRKEHHFFYGFAGVRASGTLTSSTSNGVLNPEIVPSPRIQPQGLEKSSDATDLIRHLGAAPLVPYYKSVLESGSAGFFQQRDLRTGDTHRDSSRFRSSRPGDDIGRRNQGVPRTLDVTNVSKVSVMLVLESNVSARVSRNIIALYFFYVLVFLLHKNQDNHELKTFW